MAIDGAPRLLLLCVCVALAVSAAGCGRMQGAGGTSQDGFAVNMTVQPAQPTVGDGALIISIRDEAGRPVEGAQLTVEGNMSHAGMKPSFGRVTGGGDGQYAVAITWTMAGDWYVDIRAMLADGRLISRRLPVSIDAR